MAAKTGEICDAGVWRQEQGRTVVPIRFDPAGSVFVVFRRAAGQAGPVARIIPPESVTDVPLSISGTGAVAFPPNHGAPAGIELPELQALSEHQDPNVKHFSGTVTYTCIFVLPKMCPGDRLFLDLGRVANLSEVTVNGKHLGVLWKLTFIVETTDAVQVGGNRLSIDVTNT
jgi:hypothetical protein